MVAVSGRRLVGGGSAGHRFAPAGWCWLVLLCLGLQLIPGADATAQGLPRRGTLAEVGLRLRHVRHQLRQIQSSELRPLVKLGRSGRVVAGLLSVRQGVAYLTGTFDPIHDGHLAVARRARQELGVRRVILVPNPSPKGKTPLPLPVRLQQARRAVAGLRGIEVASDEVLRTFASGGHDQLKRALELRYPGQLVRVWGSDSFEAARAEGYVAQDLQLGRRHAVVPRPGYPVPSGLPAGVRLLGSSNTDLASSQLRAEMAQGHSPRGLAVPDSVATLRALYGARAASDRRDVAAGAQRR